MPLRETAIREEIHRPRRVPGNGFTLTAAQPRHVYSSMTSIAPCKTNMALPSFPMDRTYLSTRGRHACSYVKHQKTYLQLRGFDVNNIYSVNRHHGKKYGEVENQTGKSVLTLSESDLPKLTDRRSVVRKPSTNSQMTESALWHPRDSTRSRFTSANRIFPSRASTNLSCSIDKDLYSHSNKRSTNHRSQRLGKVLTRTHLRALLTQEQPLIPKAVYVSFTGVTSQKT